MYCLGYTIITLGWADRVRILFGKKVHVNISSSLLDSQIPEDFRMETRVFVDEILPHRSTGAAESNAATTPETRKTESQDGGTNGK